MQWTSLFSSLRGHSQIIRLSDRTLCVSYSPVMSASVCCFFVFFCFVFWFFPFCFYFLVHFFLSFILLLFFSGFHPGLLSASVFPSLLSFPFIFPLSIELFSSLSFCFFLFSGVPQFKFLLSFLLSDIRLISFPFFGFHLPFLTLAFLPFSSPFLRPIFFYFSALLFPFSFAHLLSALLLSLLPFPVYC